MGQWDNGTMKLLISREAHLTFHFSLFTFHLSNNRESPENIGALSYFVPQIAAYHIKFRSCKCK